MISGTDPSTPRAPRVVKPRASITCEIHPGQQHDGRAEYPGQNRNPARVLLREAQPLDDERREPGQAERQRPIGAEGRGAAADERPRGQKLEIGNARIRRRPSATVCTSGPSLPITSHATTHIRPTTPSAPNA